MFELCTLQLQRKPLYLMLMIVLKCAQVTFELVAFNCHFERNPWFSRKKLKENGNCQGLYPSTRKFL